METMSLIKFMMIELTVWLIFAAFITAMGWHLSRLVKKTNS